MRALEIAKEKNTISNTLVQAKEMRGGSRVAFDRLNEDSVILDNSVLPSENSAILPRPIVSQGEASSFSYLPSIHGVYRSKLASGASADVGASPMGYKRRRYGAS